MVAFIIFGVFALTRRIGRVLLIPVLAAQSASARRPEGKGRKDLCHDAGRTECIIFDLKMENQNLNFATALAARSASAKADKLCLYHAP